MKHVRTLIFISCVFQTIVCKASFFGLSTFLPEIWKTNKPPYTRGNTFNERRYAVHASFLRILRIYNRPDLADGYARQETNAESAQFVMPEKVQLLKSSVRTEILWFDDPWNGNASLKQLVDYFHSRQTEAERNCFKLKQTLHECGYKPRERKLDNSGLALANYLFFFNLEFKHHTTNAKAQKRFQRIKGAYEQYYQALDDYEYFINFVTSKKSLSSITTSSQQ